MKKKAIRISKDKKIKFMEKYGYLYDQGDTAKLVKLIRKKFKYSDKTYYFDILIGFRQAYQAKHHDIHII